MIEEEIQEQAEIQERVEIPKELLPKVITLEEADQIRSGVLAH